jgi:hypothetical protein
MPRRRFERIALAVLLVGAVAFGCCVLTERVQAQPGFVPRVPPPPPPVFNPSPSNTTVPQPRTVPQPSYQSISPTTLGTPSFTGVPSTTTRSHRRASTAKTRSVHHHRGRFAGITWPYYCGSSPCVHIYRSAFYGYPGPASGLWWPGYYDYAPGQFSRGRPRYSGHPRYSGYHGD